MCTWLWAYEIRITPDDVRIVAERDDVPAKTALETVTNELMSYCAPLAPRLHGRHWEGQDWRLLFGGCLEADTKAAAEAIIEEKSFHGAPQSWSAGWGEVLHLVQLPDDAHEATEKGASTGNGPRS